jgi:chromosome segregation ATPase
MIDKKYQTIIGEIRDISSDIARLDADLTKDRNDLSDSKVQMATLTGQVEQLRKEFSAVVEDINQKVTEALKPAIKEVKNLKKEMEQKKVVALKSISFWNFFRFRVKSEKKKS